MSNIVISVENISKQYRLGKVGTGTISHDLNRWWHTVRGKEDPYLKIGSENDRTKKNDSSYVWALRDINFDVKHGDVLGIIGRNGAGKSTLLKILSRTTTPTTGSIKIKGRVASLLEVGTGFHPELTGRENIFLNGAIMGMTRNDITRKFDEIVSFAGVEKYIDTPVKRYSSGMYVRLAFGVAAHLEPEILIVDEVLAVGDAEFQKKALGKMKDVSKGEGRTVLFVSHNMNSIQELCTTAIAMGNGRVVDGGDVETVVANYNKNSIRLQHEWFNSGNAFANPYFQPARFAIVNQEGVPGNLFRKDQKIGILIEGNSGMQDPGLSVGFAVFNTAGTLFFWALNTDQEVERWQKVQPGNNSFIGWIPEHILNEGDYSVELISAIHFKEWLIEPGANSPAIQFSVQGGLSNSPHWVQKRPGLIAPVIEFEKNKI